MRLPHFSNSLPLSAVLAVIVASFCTGRLRAGLPVGPGERVAAAFWEGGGIGAAGWTATGGAAGWTATGGAAGLKVTQLPGWRGFEWNERPTGGAALVYSGNLGGMPTGGADRLVVSAKLPAGASLTVSVNGQPLSLAGTPVRQEYTYALGGVTSLGTVQLTVTATRDGVGSGWFQWIVLEDHVSREAALGAERWNDPSWTRHLEATASGSATPRHGLLLTASDVSTLRSQHGALKAAIGGGPTVFEQARDYVNGQPAPEERIGRYAGLSGSRAARDSDYARSLIADGINAAIAGLVLQDPALVRLAQRYAMSLAASRIWEDGFASAGGGVTRAMNTHDAALLYDLVGANGAGMKDAGRRLLLRRIAEHGIGGIDAAMWRNNALRTGSGGCLIAPGRMIAYAVLEKAADGYNWGASGGPSVTPSFDAAYGDVADCIDGLLPGDGGFAESPPFFRVIARDGALALRYRALARGVGFTTLATTRMKQTGTYLDVLRSTVAGREILTYGDSAVETFDPAVKAAMSVLAPTSAWAGLLKETLDAQPSLQRPFWPLNLDFVPSTEISIADVVFAWKVKAPSPAAWTTPALASLPATGLAASKRTYTAADGVPRVVKLLVKGAKAGAARHHEDAGSFQLEYAGEAYVVDPLLGSGPGDLVRQARAHALLLPTGFAAGARPAPDGGVVAAADGAPFGSGGAGSAPEGDGNWCDIRMNPQPAWSATYAAWTRQWSAPNWNAPYNRILTITDTYEFQPGAGTGVEFQFLTPRAVTVTGNADGSKNVILSGSDGVSKAAFRAPAGTTVTTAAAAEFTGTSLTRVRIGKPGTSGSLTVPVYFYPYP